MLAHLFRADSNSPFFFVPPKTTKYFDALELYRTFRLFDNSNIKCHFGVCYLKRQTVYINSLIKKYFILARIVSIISAILLVYGSFFPHLILKKKLPLHEAIKCLPKDLQNIWNYALLCNFCLRRINATISYPAAAIKRCLIE
jgi:hypothetical protein